jgi:hypothetical protein
MGGRRGGGRRHCWVTQHQHQGAWWSDGLLGRWWGRGEGSVGGGGKEGGMNQLRHRGDGGGGGAQWSVCSVLAVECKEGTGGRQGGGDVVTCALVECVKATPPGSLTCHCKFEGSWDPRSPPHPRSRCGRRPCKISGAHPPPRHQTPTQCAHVGPCPPPPTTDTHTPALSLLSQPCSPFLHRLTHPTTHTPSHTLRHTPHRHTPRHTQLSYQGPG